MICEGFLETREMNPVIFGARFCLQMREMTAGQKIK
jgi:hypothetical protein